MSPARLAGRVALVTGGNRGIGRAIALALAVEGAAVAITGRDPAALAESSAALEQAGARWTAATGDVGVEAEVVRIVAQVTAALGAVDVVVNNAAAAGPTLPVHEMDEVDFTGTLRTNLVGPFLVAKHTLPPMLERRSGAIVNIGSIAGVQGYPMRSPYAASKWGLVGLTRTLAGEVGPYGVRVNLVSPGPTEGERSRSVIAARAEAIGTEETALRAQYTERIPLRRFVTAEEVAAAVVFLASDEAAGITGQSFCVSGGIEI